MVKDARDFLKKSKTKGGDDHPKIDKLDDLEERLTKNSNVLEARRKLKESV